MLDRNHIGHKFEPHTVEIEKGRLRFFAKAIGETNPIYFDESAAQAAGYRSLPVPPSFPFSIDLDSPEFLPVLGLLKMDIGRILHGSQEFEYFAPICAGDAITCQTELKEMFDKKGGALEFVVLETVFTNSDDEVVVKSTQSIVYRN
ncbi:MAG: MaoC family dehydratase N-terminal domain-containing protein [Cellvibrionaceae bacterium]